PKKGLTPTRRSPGAIVIPVTGESVVIEPLRGALIRDDAKRHRMADVARQVAAWWPTRPAHFELAAGNPGAVLYYLFPEDPHRSPYARSYSAVQRAEAVAQGVPVYVLPDVVARMRIAEGPVSTAGLIPLAGAEVDP